jgi:membrane protease subunit HflK
VTRERLYIEAVEEVYGNSNKVILDSEGSGNLLYLPLDRLLQERRDAGVPPTEPVVEPARPETADARDTDPRERRTR